MKELIKYSFILLLVSENSFADDVSGFFASADLSILNDDNIYRVTDEKSQSDSIVNFSPSIKHKFLYGKHSIETQYDGEFAKYNSSSDANFDDHQLLSVAHFEHTRKLATEFKIGFVKEHEEPGSINRVQLDINEYNLYNERFYNAAVIVGTNDSIGKLNFSYRFSDKEYENNSLEFLSNDSDTFSSLFTYRMTKKIKIYLLGDYSSFDYPTMNDFELDNDIYRVQFGSSWNYSDKLTGIIFIGYQERDYDLDYLQDITGLAYQLDLSWFVNTYSTVKLSASRQSIDSTIEESGGFLRTSYSLDLEHELTKNFNVTAKAFHARDDLISSVNRLDRRNVYTLKIRYNINSHFEISAGYDYDARSSSFELANFKANIFSINLHATMDR